MPYSFRPSPSPALTPTVPFHQIHFNNLFLCGVLHKQGSLKATIVVFFSPFLSFKTTTTYWKRFIWDKFSNRVAIWMPCQDDAQSARLTPSSGPNFVYDNESLLESSGWSKLRWANDDIGQGDCSFRYILYIPVHCARIWSANYEWSMMTDMPSPGGTSTGSFWDCCIC